MRTVIMAMIAFPLAFFLSPSKEYTALTGVFMFYAIQIHATLSDILGKLTKSEETLDSFYRDFWSWMNAWRQR